MNYGKAAGAFFGGSPYGSQLFLFKVLSRLEWTLTITIYSHGVGQRLRDVKLRRLAVWIITGDEVLVPFDGLPSCQTLRLCEN